MSRAHPAIVSHRGLGFGHPENSLAAFAAVRDRGSLGVELDARITRDGVAVVHHDPTVLLEDGRRAAIDALDAASLVGVLPTLRDALRALDGLLVDLEIKATEASIDPVLREVGDGKVRLSSFSTTVLEQARGKAPSLPRALLLEPEDDVPRAVGEAVRLGAEGVHVHGRLLTPAFVQGWRAAGLAVRAYTLNDAEDWAQATDLRIDAIITDHPLELEAWIARRSDPGERARPK